MRWTKVGNKVTIGYVGPVPLLQIDGSPTLCAPERYISFWFGDKNDNYNDNNSDNDNDIDSDGASSIQ